MKTRKQNLISKLQTAIHALETDTVHYNWFQPESCNCGVVAQAILKVTQNQLERRMDEEKTHDTFSLASALHINLDEANRTWKNSAKAFCPITGVPLKQIFKDLYEAGLTKEDICHLEFMNNPLILKKSGIDTTRKKVLKSGIFNQIFKRYKYDNWYYNNKINLIKYLKAWVEILKEQPEFNSLSEQITSIDELRSMEMTAVANQDFELAVEIRDRISSLKK